MTRYMSEEQALQRWCPFARSADYYADPDGRNKRPATINRLPDTDGALDPDCLCVTSDCMAWRWEPDADSKPVARGFCGLVGAP